MADNSVHEEKYSGVKTKIGKSLASIAGLKILELLQDTVLDDDARLRALEEPVGDWGQAISMSVNAKDGLQRLYSDFLKTAKQDILALLKKTGEDVLALDGTGSNENFKALYCAAAKAAGRTAAVMILKGASDYNIPVERRLEQIRGHLPLLALYRGSCALYCEPGAGSITDGMDDVFEKLGASLGLGKALLGKDRPAPEAVRKGAVKARHPRYRPSVEDVEEAAPGKGPEILSRQLSHLYTSICKRAGIVYSSADFANVTDCLGQDGAAKGLLLPARRGCGYSVPFADSEKVGSMMVEYMVKLHLLNEASASEVTAKGLGSIPLAQIYIAFTGGTHNKPEYRSVCQRLVQDSQAGKFLKPYRGGYSVGYDNAPAVADRMRHYLRKMHATGGAPV